MDPGKVIGVVHELAKGTKVPSEVFNRNVAKIQESVGLTSGSVQELSTRNLQQLAASSTRPTDFISKYKEAASQNTQNLTTMLEVLSDVTKDAKLKKFLGQKAAASGVSEFQSLKERILQQAGPLAVAESAPGKRRQKRLFPERPHLTLDFLSSDLIMKDRALGELGQIPVKSQESAIIQDLLYCFLGIEGVHIKPQKAAGSSKLSFVFDDTLDPSLKELVARIFPLCQNYSVVVQFAEDKMQFDSGRVNQALAGAMYSLLEDYYIFVSQMETQQKKGELSLNKIWCYIQPTLQTMEMLAEVCQAVDKLAARGGKTLSLLHQQMTSHSSNENCRVVAEYLAKTAAKPYFEVLSRWIHRGIIMDGGKDFFVEDNEVIERSTLPLQYSDDYWEKRYTFRSDQIPTFLHAHADMILRTGKYLNVIQQCDKSIKWSDEVEQIEFKANSEQYFEPLEKAYAFAAKTLLDLLVKDRDLIGHLRSVKHYFLLDQGDFIVQFLDLCETELSQNVNCVEPTRLESLLELAQRTSAANSDPYKDNVGIELLPYDLIFQMCKILSIDTDSEQDFKSPTNTDDLTGLEAFAFCYGVQWPVSLVLNRKSLACYQMLFRHLLFCKHVERRLCGAWIHTKSCTEKQFSNSFALRQKMLNFLQNLEYYMTFEVLEPNWEMMISKIRSGKVANVDQVLKIHSDFLSMCLNDCMLSSPQLLTTVKKLLGVCLEFAKFVEDASFSSNRTKEETESYHDNVNKFDLRFSSVLFSLLDKISQMGRDNYNEKILNILNRLDFNGYYTKALEQFGHSAET